MVVKGLEGRMGWLGRRLGSGGPGTRLTGTGTSGIWLVGVLEEPVPVGMVQTRVERRGQLKL